MIIAVCLLAFYGNAQYKIISATPSQLMQGDTLTVTFTYADSDTPNQLNLSPLPAGSGPYGKAWQIFRDSLLVINGIYTMKIVIPSDFRYGPALISNDWKIGKEIFVGRPILTGIPQYENNQLPTNTYTDFSGNKSTLRSSEPLIENGKRKILVQSSDF